MLVIRDLWERGRERDGDVGMEACQPGLAPWLSKLHMVTSRPLRVAMARGVCPHDSWQLMWAPRDSRASTQGVLPTDVARCSGVTLNLVDRARASGSRDLGTNTHLVVELGLAPRDSSSCTVP